MSGAGASEANSNVAATAGNTGRPKQQYRYQRIPKPSTARTLRNRTVPAVPERESTPLNGTSTSDLNRQSVQDPGRTSPAGNPRKRRVAQPTSSTGNTNAAAPKRGRGRPPKTRQVAAAVPVVDDNTIAGDDRQPSRPGSPLQLAVPDEAPPADVDEIQVGGLSREGSPLDEEPGRADTPSDNGLPEGRGLREDLREDPFLFEFDREHGAHQGEEEEDDNEDDIIDVVGFSDEEPNSEDSRRRVQSPQRVREDHSPEPQPVMIYGRVAIEEVEDFDFDLLKEIILESKDFDEEDAEAIVPVLRLADTADLRAMRLRPIEEFIENELLPALRNWKMFRANPAAFFDRAQGQYERYHQGTAVVEFPIAARPEIFPMQIWRRQRMVPTEDDHVDPNWIVQQQQQQHYQLWLQQQLFLHQLQQNRIQAMFAWLGVFPQL